MTALYERLAIMIIGYKVLFNSDLILKQNAGKIRE